MIAAALGAVAPGDGGAPLGKTGQDRHGENM
jgi:hypothetical protein